MKGLPYELSKPHRIIAPYAMLYYKHGKISKKKTA